MIGGVMNMAGTAAGMEQSRRQNRDYMSALFPQSADSTGLGTFQGTGATDSAGIARELMQDESMQGFRSQRPQMQFDPTQGYQPYTPTMPGGNPRMGNMQLAQDPYDEYDELENSGFNTRPYVGRNAGY
jgi:hypothetical protein